MSIGRKRKSCRLESIDLPQGLNLRRGKTVAKERGKTDYLISLMSMVIELIII